MPCLAEPAKNDGSDEIEMPGIEFLEFLGEWETDDGEWLDPELLDEDAFSYVNEERPSKADD